jgi:hypothetical protein
VLAGYSLFVYTPNRLWEMHGMYNINRAMLEPFQTTESQKLLPALIIVHVQGKWTEYGGLLELQNAQLTSPFIFVLNHSDSVIAEYYERFPDRKIYHYYPDEPYIFYQTPRHIR